MDETYILESCKGKSIPKDYWRKARKHGAVAKKPGLSNEYICVCAGVERNGGALSMAVSRATAGSDDINKVFGGRIKGKVIAMTDGLQSYNILKKGGKCAVFDASRLGNKHFHINTVNGFHSFIQERNRAARGYATKYLNRYNALFSKVYRATDDVSDDIYSLLFDRNERNHTIEEFKTMDLLDI